MFGCDRTPKLALAFPVDDVALSILDGRAFGRAGGVVQQRARRLNRHGRTWKPSQCPRTVGRLRPRLQCTPPTRHRGDQRRGIGQLLVQTLVRKREQQAVNGPTLPTSPTLKPFTAMLAGSAQPKPD